MIFEIKSIDNKYWQIYQNNVPWSQIGYYTEWEAIQELYDEGYEIEALKLQLLFESQLC